MMSFQRPLKLLAALATGTMLLSACENTGGSASSGVYYDSMMWNDYYYRPNPPRPERPPRPEHPIERPERPVHPIAPRPPVSRPTPRPSPRPSPRR